MKLLQFFKLNSWIFQLFNKDMDSDSTYVPSDADAPSPGKSKKRKKRQAKVGSSKVRLELAPSRLALEMGKRLILPWVCSYLTMDFG